MAILIEMPKLSDTMITGKVLSWIKNEGDAFEEGTVIAEVETDKATMEVNAFDDGTLLKILAPVESAVPIGGPLAIMGEPGEDIAELVKQAEAYSSDAAIAEAESSSEPAVAQETAAAPSQPATPSSGKIKITPVAQRMATEHNLDVRMLKGSGPSGRIVKKDVEAAISQGMPAQSVTSSLQMMQAVSSVPYEDIALSSIRATVASRLPQSLGPIPHFYLEVDMDAEPLIVMKDQLKAVSGDIRITVTDLLIKACAVALKQHPEVNSQYMGNAVRRFNVVNVGLAVAGKGTLLVPVIPSCDAKTVSQIALDRAVVVEKGQLGKLTPEEMTNGTFTISNLGMFGITRFKAIINPPQAAILAVGAIRDEAVVKDGAVVPGKKMALCLSCDHRTFDGAEGAQFMATLRSILENPVSLCL